VDTFGTGVAPIALVVAVQSSGISSAALAKVRKIGAMIQPLITGERGCAAVVAFAERVQWLQECTNDPEAITSAFYKIEPGDDKTARMLDAVGASIERLRDRPKARQVLLLISESRDRGSESELEAVVAAAQSAGVTIYAIVYSAFQTALTAKSSEIGNRPVQKGRETWGKDPGSHDAPERSPIPPPTEQRVDILAGLGELARLGKTKTAEVLSRGTGGAMLSFTRRKGLEDAVASLASDLHSQYVLGFVPQVSAPGYHRIEVRITRPGNFRIRARPGYCVPSGRVSDPLSVCLASAHSTTR